MLLLVCPDCGKSISMADMACHSCGFSFFHAEQSAVEFDSLIDPMDELSPYGECMPDEGDEFLDLVSYLSKLEREIA